MHSKLSSVGLTLVLALATTLASAAPGAASDERGRNRVLIKDDCDPATFNAAIGPGTCVGKGETTFSEFIAELQEDRAVDDWTFDPDELSVVAGAKVTVKNVGGETHTLTRVAAFGPGVVPLLNQLVFGREGPPQPEFLPFDPAHNANLNLVPSGGTLALSTGAGTPLVLGKNRVECGIHPWMRMIINVKRSDSDKDKKDSGKRPDSD